MREPVGAQQQSPAMTDTPTPAPNKRTRIATASVRLALVVGLICGAAALLAGPGYRIGWWSLGAGIQTVRWAATVALAGALVALVAGLVLRVARAPRSAFSLAVVALAVNLLVAGPPLHLYREAQRLPAIHDISTDTDRPPQFVAVLPLRKGARNPVDYLPATAAAQKKGYPDILPLLIDASPTFAFERAERAARAMGWDIVAVSPQDGRIEATDTTPLFGFKDDIVIRITPQAQGSIVDMRSLSRVGGSDIGTNARRIRAFMQKLSGT